MVAFMCMLWPRRRDLQARSGPITHLCSSAVNFSAHVGGGGAVVGRGGGEVKMNQSRGGGIVCIALKEDSFPRLNIIVCMQL